MLCIPVFWNAGSRTPSIPHDLLHSLQVRVRIRVRVRVRVEAEVEVQFVNIVIMR